MVTKTRAGIAILMFFNVLTYCPPLTIMLVLTLSVILAWHIARPSKDADELALLALSGITIGTWLSSLLIILAYEPGKQMYSVAIAAILLAYVNKRAQNA